MVVAINYERTVVGVGMVCPPYWPWICGAGAPRRRRPKHPPEGETGRRGRRSRRRTRESTPRSGRRASQASVRPADAAVSVLALQRRARLSNRASTAAPASGFGRIVAIIAGGRGPPSPCRPHLMRHAAPGSGAARMPTATVCRQTACQSIGCWQALGTANSPMQAAIEAGQRANEQIEAAAALSGMAGLHAERWARVLGLIETGPAPPKKAEAEKRAPPPASPGLVAGERLLLEPRRLVGATAPTGGVLSRV